MQHDEPLDMPIRRVIDTLTEGDPTPGEVMARVLDLAVAIEPVDGASITIFGPEQKPVTYVASADWVREVDGAQYAALQGPCLQVASSSAPIASAVELAGSAWPVFGAKAAELGVHAVLAAGLCGRPDPGDRTRPPGALNLYARREVTFDDAVREQATLLAAIAGLTLALAQQRLTQRRFHEALSSRDVIGQAKGILMERHGIGAEEAFATLRRASNRLNVKLRDIAQRVTDRPRER